MAAREAGTPGSGWRQSEPGERCRSLTGLSAPQEGSRRWSAAPPPTRRRSCCRLLLPAAEAAEYSDPFKIFELIHPLGEAG